MTDPKHFPYPLRIELTILDDSLHRKEVKFDRAPLPHLLYSTLYEDAVTPPFPAEGKDGVSIFVGRKEQFEQMEVALLWELEKKRGRARLAVVTNLRGNEFGPAFRKLSVSLGDPHLVPTAFMRRRGLRWDSLDFFSKGDSPSMEGAAPRLKRLKQRGWEAMVDILALTDAHIKGEYFETLEVERERLKKAFFEGVAGGRVSGLIGIAGQCLSKEHMPTLLREPTMTAVLFTCLKNMSDTFQPAEWLYLTKRDKGDEMLLFAQGEQWLEKDQVLYGIPKKGGRRSEFLVSKVLQRSTMELNEAIFTAIWVRVDWGYRSVREIPVGWTQNSTLPAGSNAVHG